MKTLIGLILGLSFTFSFAIAGDDATLKAKVETSAAVAGVVAPTGFIDTVCTNGTNTRKVQLITAANESKVPCEVHYKKETEQAGHDQVLWTATNDVSFCHAKASAFVDKLTGMGWACAAK